jgi:hypothetical protein
MEWLWIREVRRAARCASAPFARQVALGCGATAVGTIVAFVLPPAVGWGCGAGRLGRCVGGSCIRRHLDPRFSLVTCGRNELADFGTTTGLRDMMTSMLVVLFSSSSFAGQAPVLSTARPPSRSAGRRRSVHGER